MSIREGAGSTGGSPWIDVSAAAEAERPRTFVASFGMRLTALSPDRAERGVRTEELAAERLADQADFINSLWTAAVPSAYSLRLSCSPLDTAPLSGEVAVRLFGHTVAADEGEAIRRAKALAPGLRLLCGAHHREAEWATMTERAEFEEAWRPFEPAAGGAVEICRRVEHVHLEASRERPALGRRQDPPHGADDGEAVFFVHPFLPRPSTWERLLRVLLHAPHPTSLTVTLTPTELSAEERDGLLAEIVRCEQALVETGRAADTVHAARAHALRGVLVEQLARLSDAPFELRVLLTAPRPLAAGIADAVAVEMTAPVGARSGFLREGAAALLQAGGYDLRDVLPGDVRPAQQSSDGSAPPPAVEPPEGLSRLPHLVDAQEAATAFRLPIATRDGLPGLVVRSARRRPVPRAVAMRPPGEGVHIGESRHHDNRQPVYVAARDRSQHMYVVGQTGTGKTTLLKHMILDDVLNGRGLAVVDPHGDLFEELLAAIPASRWDDVVVLDPTDSEHPVGLNLLECGRAEDRHFVVREMHAIMSRLLEDQYGTKSSEFAGPVFFQHMQMNMLLAMSDPAHPGTLLQFYEIFRTSEFYRRWVPPVWSDPLLDRWVNGPLMHADYQSRKAGEVSVGEWISSKFDEFVLDPVLRNMFGQARTGFDFLDVMDTGKILLVNLAKGALTEQNSRFLGMIIMAKLQAAAMRRGRYAKEDRRPFYLYVDEFQNLATDNFVLMLSEARKFGLGLVLANQFLSQIDNRRIVDAIFGNVGTICAFRVGRKDAEMLEPQFGPHFSEHDLANLPNWEACLRTTVDGQMAPPFSVSTMVRDDAPASEQTAAEVRARSARAYGRPLAEVEEEIARSLQPLVKPEEGRAGSKAAVARDLMRDMASGREPGGGGAGARASHGLTASEVTELIDAVEKRQKARDAGDLPAECEAGIDYARACFGAGDVQTARSTLERIVEQAAKITGQRSSAMTRCIALTDLAKVREAAGDRVQAIESLEQAIELDRVLGKNDWLAGDLRRLADWYRREGQGVRADELMEEARAAQGARG